MRSETATQAGSAVTILGTPATLGATDTRVIIRPDIEQVGQYGQAVGLVTVAILPGALDPQPGDVLTVPGGQYPGTYEVDEVLSRNGPTVRVTIRQTA